MNRLIHCVLIVLFFFSTASVAQVSATKAPPLPRIAILYDGGESTGPAELKRATDNAAALATVTIFAPGDGGAALTDQVDLASFDLVLLDGTARGVALTAQRLAAIKAKTQLFVIPADTASTSNAVLGNVDTTKHADVAKYWNNRSVQNDEALIAYLVARVLQRPMQREIPAPIIYPDHGFYHPAATALFPDRASYLAWYAARRNGHRYDASKLSLGLTTHRSLVQVQNLSHIDALIASAEEQGHNIFTLVRKSDADFSQLMQAGRPVIDVLMFDGEFINRRDLERGRTDAKKLGVPLLMTMSLFVRTAEQYRESPGGLAPELTARVVNSERDGMIEPLVIGGKDANASTRKTLPLAEQIAWRIKRAASWAQLSRKGNATKRVVFTYWSEAGGKADIGADPDDFLDIQGSLATMLPAMRARGYNVGVGALPTAEELSIRMSRKASNVGAWALGELAKMVKEGEVVLLSEAKYLEWYKTVPAKRRAEIESMWGPPPGKSMVYVAKNGSRSIVIPRLAIGNVLVAPHPMWGYYENEKALMSKDALPPHHQYLAFFLWLQKDWKADAWVSLFTNISLQGGKSEGPLADDHVGVELGGIPHIHPERLGSAGGMSNKRKALAQTTGWYNIVVRLDDKGATGPWGAKILGTAPTGDVLSQMVAGMLGADLEQALKPFGADAPRALTDLVRAVLQQNKTPGEALTARFGRSDVAAEAVLALALDYAARLNQAPREVEAILESLEGRYIVPGPMGEPYRRPDTLPPGRALYHFDQRAIPTPLAVTVGVQQAEGLISAHRAANANAYPKKLALILWSGENAKNGGVAEASALHLLGTRVLRNWRGEVTGVELIPRAELGRPRVDVLVQTSGTYRDHFQDKVALIADAVQLAAASPEADNPVGAATRDAQAALVAAGESPDRAAALARARVFAPAPGAYSPSIQFLAKSGDLRGDEARMANLFTLRMSHAYGAGLYGDAARAGFESNLRRMDGASLSRSSDVNGMLDHPMSAGFLGGLNLAAKKLTGRETALYVTSQRDMGNPTVLSAREALSTELRTRYFNRDWLRENQTHGYDGARTFMLATDHLDLWNSTAKQMVTSADWSEVKSVFVDDKLGLDMDRFFDRANPFAQQVLLGNLIGAADRGHWQASAEEMTQVVRRLAESVRDHGPACEAGQCRNTALTERVASVLGADSALAKTYGAAIARATQPLSDALGALVSGGAPGALAASVRAQAKALLEPAKKPASTSEPMAAANPIATPIDTTVRGQVMKEVSNATVTNVFSFKAFAWFLALFSGLFIIGLWMAGRHRSQQN